MNLSKTVLLCLLVVATAQWGMAQRFLPGSQSFSAKKTSYVTMEDGSEIKGSLRNFKRKKGLIKEIKVRTTDGEVMKISPAKVKNMYLPQSGLEKLAQALDLATDAQKWDNPTVDQSIVGEGYAYFEKSEVMIKKKKRTMLMMLLNPGYSSKVKVYFDPFAKESASAGVGGITLAGGDLKSYYIKKGDEVAYRIKRKDYKGEFPIIFKDCPSLITMHKDKLKWNEMALHIYTYTTECTGQ
ncbi:MAG: hypothetical protein AAFW73_04540 [Bacteroidota bacterium]